MGEDDDRHGSHQGRSLSAARLPCCRLQSGIHADRFLHPCFQVRRPGCRQIPTLVPHPVHDHPLHGEPELDAGADRFRGICGAKRFRRRRPETFHRFRMHTRMSEVGVRLIARRDKCRGHQQQGLQDPRESSSFHGPGGMDLQRVFPGLLGKHPSKFRGHSRNPPHRPFTTLPATGVPAPPTAPPTIPTDSHPRDRPSHHCPRSAAVSHPD